MSLKQNLATNLHLLASQYKSISEVCRRLGINRQQFNKYLSGSTMPSAHTLRRICEFFRVDETEIVLPATEFAAIADAGARPRSHMRQLSPFEHFLGGFPHSRQRLQRYLGYYFCYYCSPAFPQQIIKALSCFYEKDGAVLERTIERLADKRRPQPSGARYPVCKYASTVVHSDDRICIVQHGSTFHQTLSLIILYPSHRATPSILSGVFATVSGGPARQAYAARVAFEFLGRETDLRAAIAACGLYADDGPEVSDDIRQRIRNTIAPGENALRATEF